MSCGGPQLSRSAPVRGGRLPSVQRDSNTGLHLPSAASISVRLAAVIHLASPSVLFGPAAAQAVAGSPPHHLGGDSLLWIAHCPREMQVLHYRKSFWQSRPAIPHNKRCVQHDTTPPEVTGDLPLGAFRPQSRNAPGLGAPSPRRTIPTAPIWVRFLFPSLVVYIERYSLLRNQFLGAIINSLVRVILRPAARETDTLKPRSRPHLLWRQPPLPSAPKWRRIATMQL